MELRHLRYFREVANLLSFIKAAESLHVSQPTISRQIQELESEIQALLFKRSGNKTELTQVGEYFKTEVDCILGHVKEIAQTAKIMGRRQSEKIAIGCVDFFFEGALLPILGIYRTHCPDISVGINLMSTEMQEKALRSGEIDVAFLRPDRRRKNLKFHALYKKRLALIFPATIYDGTDLKVCLANLRNHHFVVPSRQSAPGLVDRMLAICAKHCIRPEIKLEINDPRSIFSIVSSGLGWSIVPSPSKQITAAMGLGAIELPQTVDIGISYRNEALTHECLRFVEIAKGYFLDDTSSDRRSL